MAVGGVATTSWLQGRPEARLATQGEDPGQAVPTICATPASGPMRPGISARNLPTDQLPAGLGDVPLAAVLSEAQNLSYAVIEFDHYEGDIFEGIAESYRFLTSTLASS